MSTDSSINRRTIIAVWSLVVAFAIGSIGFIVWDSRSEHRVKLTAANDRISQAVARADEWITGDSSLGGEAVEQRLADALADKDATELAKAEAILRRVHDRRKLFADQARIEQAQNQANAVFENAQRQIESKQVVKSIALLRKYILDPNATHKAEAQRLLAEAECAVSDALTLDTLLAMSAEEYDRARTTGVINDGKVTNPLLIAVRKETVQRNLAEAVQWKPQEDRTCRHL